jgi:hypothetical protein
MPGRSLLLLAAAVLGTLALALAGCAGDEDAGETFERDVVEARNAADTAFARLRRPSSMEDLVDRLRTGSERVATASETVAAADAPEELTDEQLRLTTSLTRLSREFEAAANSIQLVLDAGQEQPVQSLIFDNWDTVQAALNELRTQGVDVPPLRPNGGAG